MSGVRVSSFCSLVCLAVASTTASSDDDATGLTEFVEKFPSKNTIMVGKVGLGLLVSSLVIAFICTFCIEGKCKTFNVTDRVGPICALLTIPGLIGANLLIVYGSKVANTATVLGIVGLSSVVGLFFANGTFTFPAPRERINESNKLVATNVFQDFSRPIPPAMAKFAGQLLLIVIYVHGLTERATTQSEHVFLFWLLSFVIQAMTLVTEEMNASNLFYELTFWQFVETNHKTAELSSNGEKPLENWARGFKLRKAMSMLANMTFSMIIVLTLPVQLMGATTGIDFVKDCFALVFIVGLGRCEERTFTCDLEEQYSALRNIADP